MHTFFDRFSFARACRCCKAAIGLIQRKTNFISGDAAGVLTGSYQWKSAATAIAFLKKLLLSLLLSLSKAMGSCSGSSAGGIYRGEAWEAGCKKSRARSRSARRKSAQAERRGAYASAIATFLSRSLYYFYYYLRLIMCETLFWGEFGRVQIFL